MTQRDDWNAGENRLMEPKHSGIGIASFVLSIVTGLLMFASIVVAGFMEATTPGGIDEESVEVALLGVAIIGLVMVDLVALGLGIAGLLQKSRNRLFAILGTVFSSVAVLGIVLLMVIGSMM